LERLEIVYMDKPTTSVLFGPDVISLESAAHLPKQKAPASKASDSTETFRENPKHSVIEIEKHANHVFGPI